MRRMLLGTAIGWLAFAGVGVAGAAPSKPEWRTDAGHPSKNFTKCGHAAGRSVVNCLIRLP